MDDGIWISGGVVEKLGGRFRFFVGSLCLLGAIMLSYAIILPSTARA